MRRLERRTLKVFLRVSIAVALGAPPAGAAEDAQQQGTALVDRARSLETLLASDTGPFHLRVRVALFGMVAGTVEGDYLLFAASPERWFEQTRFPGYSELSGLYDGERWRKRNVADKPFRFHEVAQLLSPARHLELPSDARVGKLVQRKVAGTQATCIQVSPTSALWQRERAGQAAMSPVATSEDSEVTLCFDPGSGLLLGATYETDLPRFEYEGQVALGDRLFPRVLRCYEGKELVVEATVEELVREQVQDPAGFAPPAGASRWPFCASPDPPQLIERKRSERHLDDRIRSYSKAHRQYGTVYCLAEVGIDGRVHDFTWLRFTAGGPAAAVREAVKTWVYQPGTCGGVPVPVTIYLAYTIPP